ncbi:hypothetical protein COY26_01945 [Candidatus Woesearchaeota archaeon CG_4_10_14_0_2_um_filter_33_10]|nr:MAG: hypothetical protein AUJ83_04400 [Candidatus Woesearchaeota archaeon CG1_02_33_12]PIN78027.1 MAG: hypothetical protein COV14_04635 [Candidatus Woesearchaeota archaeon CG10_big_fil_rev_8_21_14_0_10_33_12]PIU72571.1 MAG: hypothetical protein COS79_02230 [Candidatus Woesearchaeota archaeon CG06_land_8_20_14_3_00_33_13]PIZ53419.1 MAG: hypothetical protein COY26_01945 [Candidatus Woesearchaeota archaeon CG_4_10_14_0_2_um_filter_33_10]
MKDTLKMIGLYVGVTLALLGLARGINIHFNNRTINKPAYYMESRAIGLSGHVEYIKYADGSQDVKEYPGFGHRLFDSQLSQDLDGDGLVDRIRKNGSEFKMNGLSELLVRKYDYESNKERFDKEDKKLQELATKYSKPFINF